MVNQNEQEEKIQVVEVVNENNLLPVVQNFRGIKYLYHCIVNINLLAAGIFFGYQEFQGL